MLSIQQHIVLSRARAESPDTENVVIQFRGPSGNFADYSRTTREKAAVFLQTSLRQSPNNWKGVDWITGEEINFEAKVRPEEIKELLDKNNPWNVEFDQFSLYNALEGIEREADAAKRALEDENEGDLKLHIEFLAAIADKANRFAQGM